MSELHWNFGWTLATLGMCWMVLSCAVALAIGQIIRRGKVSAVEAPSSTMAGSVDVADAWNEQPASLEDLPELETGSRQASGTRLKPVVLPHEAPEHIRQVG